MKLLTTALLLCFAANSHAYMGGGSMEGMDMQQMQAKMNEMKSCMDKVDKDKVEAMQKRGVELVNEVKALCKKGQRDAANNKAIAFAKQLHDSKELAQIRECGKIVGMQPTPPQGIAEYQGRNFEDKHVCDY